MLWISSEILFMNLFYFCLFLQIGFAAEFAFKLKLIDTGIPKDDIMMINTSMLLVRFVSPFIISKYTSGPKPMSIFLRLMPIR